VASTITARRTRRSSPRAPFGDGIRVRLLPYFLVLALPLAVGVWAFANYAADASRDDSDARVLATARAAAGAYGGLLDEAATRARLLAQRPAVQRALARRDRSALRSFARANPETGFFAGGKLLAGAVPRDAAVREAVIRSGKRTVGRVSAVLPLNDELAKKLRKRIPIKPDERLMLVRGGGLGLSPGRPGDLSRGDERYRGVSVQIADRGKDLRLVAATPKEPIDAEAAHARRRVILAGLAILGGVGLVAYAFAPAFARSRLAQQQRAQAVQVLSHLGDGVFLVDGDRTIRYWNPAAAAITGLDHADVQGRPPDAVFRGWSEAPPSTVAAEPGAPPPPAQPETGLYGVNGRELWLSFSGVEFPEGTVYAFRDLTEEHRLEEVRSDFVATVSHELRTPLASIAGAAATLRERPELAEATRRQLLTVLYDQSDRLARLADQIMLANQLSSGGVRVDPRPFDAKDVARAVVDAARESVPAELELELRAPQALPLVLADPARTRQVLANLVENAVNYSPGGGSVRVDLQRAGDRLRFTVRDEGLGIPAEEERRIFEKFYRLDPAMTRGVGGSGLGLYICRELVELMGGRIWVRSRPGAGSTFSFELPLAR
jgi:PAS domain S-box-containing protein